MEVIIATIGIMFLLAYIMLKSENEFLQLLMFGLLISSLMLLSGAVHHESNCEILQTNILEVDSAPNKNITVTNERVCQATPSPSSESFVKYITWVVRILWIYLVFYMLYKAVTQWFKIGKKKNDKKKR